MWESDLTVARMTVPGSMACGTTEWKMVKAVTSVKVGRMCWTEKDGRVSDVSLDCGRAISVSKGRRFLLWITLTLSSSKRFWWINWRLVLALAVIRLIGMKRRIGLRGSLLGELFPKIVFSATLKIPSLLFFFFCTKVVHVNWDSSVDSSSILKSFSLTTRTGMEDPVSWWCNSSIID